jgi:hypothetical protein
MSLDLEIPEINLTEPVIQKRFDHLQKKLINLWKSIECLNQDEQTIVVVPSLTVDITLPGSELQAYEERFLFLLLLLRQPRARLIYVTSQVILPSIVDYYLGLLPGVIASHARQRLFLVTPQDGAPQPLSVKLLQRPRLIKKLKSLILDTDRAHLLPFNTTTHERNLALRLGIPMYATDPKFLHFGTKTGCRKLFSNLGISHPSGFEDLYTLEDLVKSIIELRKNHPQLSKLIVKLNEGVSGYGNAVVNLQQVSETGDNRDQVLRCVQQMKFESQELTLEIYLEKLSKVGGVIEECIEAKVLKSPSVQLRITPLGKVELLSTHDQLLGGPSGQSFIGSCFPAHPGYAPSITRDAAQVGEYLANQGVIGRFAIDFVSAKTYSQGWKSYAIELNLRKGGTTHPFLTLQFLTDGTYDPEKAEFRTPNGQIKCFVASDHVESPLYRAFTPDEIFDIAVRHGFHFDQTRQTGVVFHMMSSLGDRGRMGLTAVENSHMKAELLFTKMVETLNTEAGEALLSDPL